MPTARRNPPGPRRLCGAPSRWEAQATNNKDTTTGRLALAFTFSIVAQVQSRRHEINAIRKGKAAGASAHRETEGAAYGIKSRPVSPVRPNRSRAVAVDNATQRS